MAGNHAPEASSPWCPFCGLPVGRPSLGAERKLNEFPTGRCECGATYVSEITGHNIGSAMVECLVTACNDEWDLAWELIPEDDYLTGRVEDYDEVTHQVVPKRNLDGRAVRGVLYFVRLHKDVSEIASRFQQKVAPGVEEAATEDVVPPTRDPKAPRKRADKNGVKAMALAGDYAALSALAFDDRRTLRFLQRLLYTPIEEERFRHAWVIGRVCGTLASRQPGPVADLMHRLFEVSTDSASTSWGMIEAIGAIIANRSDIFGAFTRHLLNFLGDPQVRFGVLWGLAEIARTRPDLIRATPFYTLFKLLEFPDPRTRAMTLVLLGRIKATEAAFQILALEQDHTPCMIYDRDQPVRTTIADLAKEAGRCIHQGEPNGK
jgi:hypothetical protein